MSNYASRLNALRAELSHLGYDGFLVPMADEYQSEYVPASAQRIGFLSGFTGSSAFLVIMKDKAAFFTDGRYTLQASQQISDELFTIFDVGATAPSAWLATNTAKGQKIAFDPWLHTADTIERLTKALLKTGAELVPLSHNPIDKIWDDRPALPAEPIYAYDMIYAGKSNIEKREMIASELQRKNLSAAVITDPASIAWLLNIRGGDVPNTPLPLSFAIIRASSRVKWFVDGRKVTGGLQDHLTSQVDIEDPKQFPYALDQLANEKQPVRIDPTEAASWILERLKAAKVQLDLGEDLCVLPKACKNQIELEGMRSAHRRDGAALVKFFAWLEKALVTDTVTEISAEEKLAEFRSAHNLYRGPSFDTISGAGGHGAIVHYRATQVSNRKLENGQLYLLDSGGQYLDGTTDVTRTISIGAPTAEMRDRFTRVLKGHIALASIRFPEGTTGADLDVLARQPLWAVGLDYNHGTGHGVGTYLGVHEGPQGISKRNKVPLKPGMVVSNEPGYYKAGQYGIRVENLQAVVETVDISSERKMLGFETLTLVPIDRRLIEVDMLTKDERDWVNNYHIRVRESIRPQVDAETVKWLTEATKAI
ncbi:MAG: aminopeptidase P family protein [Alphaproteobacteria bacterium]